MERGIASDELMRNLADVCLELGHTGEAVRVFRQMNEGAARNALGSKLTRLGLLLPEQPQQAAANPGPHGGQIAASRKPAAAHAGPRTAAPSAARPAVPAANIGTIAPAAKPEPFLLTDHLRDAFHFLAQGHTPVLALVTTLAFPLVVGLGGVLTAGGSPLLLAAAAAIPGLCVLMLVGAMGRHIFLDAVLGRDEPPPIPAVQQLSRDAGRFLADAGLTLLAMLGVPALVAICKGSYGTVVAGTLLGMFLGPMAFALRQIRGDFESLSPVLHLRSILVCRNYFGLCLAVSGMFAPALLLIWATLGYQPWLQISAAGPLLVLPVFIVGRLLGTYVAAHRAPLAAFAPSLLWMVAQEGADAAPAAAAGPANHPAAPARRTGDPAPRPPKAKQPAAPETPNPAAPARRRNPPSHIRRAQQALPARPKTIADLHAVANHKQMSPMTSAPAPKLPDQAKGAAGIANFDLTKIPGAVVVSGKDRQRHGAAAPTKI
jgi:hypothetical protein